VNAKLEMDSRLGMLMSVGNHVTVLQLVRGPSARLGSALGRWNPVRVDQQTGLCIYSCFHTYRSELFNRVLSNQQTEMLHQIPQYFKYCYLTSDWEILLIGEFDVVLVQFDS